MTDSPGGNRYRGPMGEADEEISTLGQRAADGDRRSVVAVDLAIDRARAKGDWQGVNAALQPIALAAGSGDDEALSLLLGLIDGHRLALPAIQRFLSDDFQIEEAAQSTLVAAARGIGGFEGRSRFTSWLYVVASNEARQLIRRESRKPVPVETSEPRIEPGLRHMSSILVDRMRIEAAIGAVDEPYRTALRMREMDGLSYDEIADRLGVQPGTVKSRIARGRERVAEALGLG